MDCHAIEYYSVYTDESSQGKFHRVIFLHEEPILNWQEASKLAPCLCRGWYELALLSSQDRIEFTREFWLSKLSYHSHLTDFLINFFAALDEIGVILIQKKYDDPFEAQLVYSMSENNGFFHGASPAKEADIIALQKDFPNAIFPSDYRAFLQIHNGFAKSTDTGIFPSGLMKKNYNTFQTILENKLEPLITTKNTSVNPHALIPFYQSYETPFFQCFWSEWYPEQEMGNIYYSDSLNKLAVCANKGEEIETMAFETFTDWLVFYLEKIN